MDELQRIAFAHYNKGSQGIQDKANAFFNAMDVDGDRKVSELEFKEFMQQQAGYGYMSSTEFFRWFDRDNNNTLDFWEVMTVYYIIKSGRPFCRLCRNLIMSTYFACVECFETPTGPYCLCMVCYAYRNCSHNHGGRGSQFLDNFTFLEAKRSLAIGNRYPAQAASGTMVTTSQQTYQAQSASGTMVTASQGNYMNNAAAASGQQSTLTSAVLGILVIWV